jgi:hypothetical protein
MLHNGLAFYPVLPFTDVDKKKVTLSWNILLPTISGKIRLIRRTAQRYAC